MDRRGLPGGNLSNLIAEQIPVFIYSLALSAHATSYNFPKIFSNDEFVNSCIKKMLVKKFRNFRTVEVQALIVPTAPIRAMKGHNRR